MLIQDLVPVGSKTTMRIGGQARYFAELENENDVEEAWKFAHEKNIPLIVLGGGSNTVFADGVIEALVVRLKTNKITVEGNHVTIDAGVILGSLLNELAKQNLDLSAFTGIPGTLGGALFGNAGQGPGGIWLNQFVETVRFYDGEWKTFTRDECKFEYRESIFKKMHPAPIIWQATLAVLSKSKEEVMAEIERLLKKRIETQPHLKTAGSCFKALPDGTPAWKLIEAAGLRGRRIGGIEISEKHANFLLNIEKGSFEDLRTLVTEVQKAVPGIAGVEMRLFGNDGRIMQ